MVTASVVLVTGAVAASADPGPSVADGVDKQRVAVTGEGRAAGKPSIMTFTAEVEIRDAVATSAFDEVGQAVRKVLDAVRAAGIADEDIQTTGISLDTEQVGEPGEPVRVVGYRAAGSLRVTVRDLSQAGPVLDAVADSDPGGAVRLNGVSFDVTPQERDALVEQARKDAYTRAADAAKQYAVLAGMELGPVLALTDQVNVWPASPVGLGGGALDVRASISPGQHEVVVVIQVVFQLC